MVVIGVVSMLNKHINYNESQLKINNTPPQTTEKSSHHRPPQTPKNHHKPPQATTDHQPQHTHLLCHHPHRAQLNGVFEGLQPLQLLPLRRAHHQHPVALAFCGGGGVDVCVYKIFKINFVFVLLFLLLLFFLLFFLLLLLPLFLLSLLFFFFLLLNLRMISKALQNSSQSSKALTRAPYTATLPWVGVDEIK